MVSMHEGEEVLHHPTQEEWSFSLLRREEAPAPLYEAFLYHNGLRVGVIPYLTLRWRGEATLLLRGLEEVFLRCFPPQGELSSHGYHRWTSPDLPVGKEEVARLWGQEVLTDAYSPLTRLVCLTLASSPEVVQIFLQGQPSRLLTRPVFSPERVEDLLAQGLPWKGSSYHSFLPALQENLSVNFLDAFGTEETVTAVRELAVLFNLLARTADIGEGRFVEELLSEGSSWWLDRLVRDEQSLLYYLLSLPWHPLQRREEATLLDYFRPLTLHQTNEVTSAAGVFVPQEGGPTTEEHLLWLLEQEDLLPREMNATVKGWCGEEVEEKVFQEIVACSGRWHQQAGFHSFLQALLPHREEFSFTERVVVLSRLLSTQFNGVDLDLPELLPQDRRGSALEPLLELGFRSTFLKACPLPQYLLWRYGEAFLTLLGPQGFVHWLFTWPGGEEPLTEEECDALLEAPYLISQPLTWWRPFFASSSPEDGKSGRHLTGTPS